MLGEAFIGFSFSQELVLFDQFDQFDQFELRTPSGQLLWPQVLCWFD